MNNSMINASVSMAGLQQKLDILGNNIANVNTVGYKRSDATFQDLLRDTINQPEGFARGGRLTPEGFNRGWSARVTGLQTIMEQGPMKETTKDTDLAIEGEGLFEVVVRGEDGAGNPTGVTAWTRNGNFQLTMQPGDPDNRYLATEEGHLVMGIVNGTEQPIRVPRDGKLMIDGDGRIRSEAPDGTSTDLGRLKLVRMIRPQLLANAGDHLYMVPQELAGAGVEVVREIDLTDPTADKAGIQVRQRFLEQSNVDLANELTEMLTVQRAYQLSARMLSTSDTMMGLANNLRG